MTFAICSAHKFFYNLQNNCQEGTYFKNLEEVNLVK